MVQSTSPRIPEPLVKNVLIAVALSFSIGFAVSASANPTHRTGIGTGPTVGESCKAAGQPCSDAEDCCSRMCRKDTKKCS